METSNSLTALSPQEQQEMIKELAALIKAAEKDGDCAPLAAAIDRWQARAQSKTLREIWQKQEPMSEEAAIELALEAQQAARQN